MYCIFLGIFYSIVAINEIFARYVSVYITGGEGQVLIGDEISFSNSILHKSKTKEIGTNRGGFQIRGRNHIN